MKEGLRPENYENEGQVDGSFELRQAMLEGKTVTIRRSNGAEDGDWEILRQVPDGKYLANKEGVGTKYIRAEDFIGFDSEFTLSKGSQVTVIRSDGQKESDWTIVDFSRNSNNTGMNVTVKSGDGKLQKVVPYDVLDRWNS